jgi:hypothetical protein
VNGSGRQPGPFQTVRFWIYTFLLLFAFFHARLVLRLLLLYRLAVAKRSRVKLAAFFCARLPDFRVFKTLSFIGKHRKQLKTA